MARSDFIVVGAGLTGIVVAERLSASGFSVQLIERRDHIGGNCFDEHDEHGVLVHRYGPHVFHTNDRRVFDYLSQFTEWRPYEHRVRSQVGERLLPIPCNLDTIQMLVEQGMPPTASEQLIARYGLGTTLNIQQLRDTYHESGIADIIWSTLYEPYTRKQWGAWTECLDASVFDRVPVRLSHDDRYFTDMFQAMPSEGYSVMFRRMLDASAKVEVLLGVDYFQAKRKNSSSRVICTASPDTYYSNRYGVLPYRSVAIRFKTFRRAEAFLGAPVVNYPDRRPITRQTEYRTLTGQQIQYTSISDEVPFDAGGGDEQMYPVPARECLEIRQKYAALAREDPRIVFAGRLGTYSYLNMDVAVGQALALAAAEVSRWQG